MGESIEVPFFWLAVYIIEYTVLTEIKMSGHHQHDKDVTIPCQYYSKACFAVDKSWDSALAGSVAQDNARKLCLWCALFKLEHLCFAGSALAQWKCLFFYRFGTKINSCKFETWKHNVHRQEGTLFHSMMSSHRMPCSTRMGDDASEILPICIYVHFYAVNDTLRMKVFLHLSDLSGEFTHMPYTWITRC
jgi:hypothetical protein